MLYACDVKWWANESKGYGQQALKEFHGQMWTQDQEARDLYGLNWCYLPGDDGLLENDQIGSGGNGGHQAINLAHHMGASEIALYGYDMQHTGGKIHNHGTHKGLVMVRGRSVAMVNPSEHQCGQWIKRFRQIAEDCKRVGLKVVNVSRETALPWFERQALEDWL